MRYIGLAMLLVSAAVASGCHVSCLSKRASEQHCPTDIRKTHCWCFGEDALFRGPCGPEPVFYGHQATCWREWPASGSHWRDIHCGPPVMPVATPTELTPTPDGADLPPPPGPALDQPADNEDTQERQPAQPDGPGIIDEQEGPMEPPLEAPEADPMAGYLPGEWLELAPRGGSDSTSAEVAPGSGVPRSIRLERLPPVTPAATSPTDVASPRAPVERQDKATQDSDPAKSWQPATHSADSNWQLPMVPTADGRSPSQGLEQQTSEALQRLISVESEPAAAK